MMTHELALQIVRERIAETEERARLVSTLGNLPQAAALFPFRRRVVSLPCAVEVLRTRRAENSRIARRLEELSSRRSA